MANLTPAQLAAADAMLAGTFDKLDTAPRMQPGYTMDEVYGPVGIGPNGPVGGGVGLMARAPIKPKWVEDAVMGRGQPGQDRLLPNNNPDIPGSGVPAMAWYNTPGYYVPKTGALAAIEQAAPRGQVPLPRPRPPNAPSIIDLAAIDAQNPNLPVKATPAVKAAYADVVAGKPGAVKKLATLMADSAQMGGINVPGAGGKGFGAFAVPDTFRTSKTGRQVQVGQTYQATNGYSYEATPNGTFQNVGYSAAEQARREAQGRGIAEANRRNPNPTYTVSGDRNDFQPRSVQESTRWQTGY